MKKEKQQVKKLQLNKETLRQLGEATDLHLVIGGTTGACTNATIVCSACKC